MRNEKIFEIFFKFVSSKNKRTLKQKSHDYSREIVIENVNEIIKLRRTKLTFKKKIIVFLSRHLCIRKNYIKNKVTAFASR